MQVYCDRLPDTKSETGRGFQLFKFSFDHAGGSDFSHMVGTLVIESPGHRIEYGVEEFPAPWAGRGFLLEKLGGAIGDRDPHTTRHECFIGRNRQDVRCDCKGFVYGKGRHCKHIESVLGCISNGWL